MDSVVTVLLDFSIPSMYTTPHPADSTPVSCFWRLPPLWWNHLPNIQLIYIINIIKIMHEAPDDLQPLYWEASYEIVLQLMRRYPNLNLDTLGLHELYELIVTLPGFADDPILANDDLLTAILQEYYEEATHL